MTRSEAIAWCNSKLGQAMNFDGQYGAQCVDFFNYYYQYLTGANPYSQGYGVPGAKDLWNVPNGQFDFIKNNPNDLNQLPSPGDIIIYSGSMPGTGGYGHVAIVGESKNVYYEQNYGGMFVKRNTRQFNGYEIGWLSFKGFGSPGVEIMNRDLVIGTYQVIRGLNPSEAEIAGWVGKPLATLVSAFGAEAKATREANTKAISGLQAQLASVQTALANEQAKPPKEVVKEVEKLVEKIVEIEKPVIVPFTDQDGLNWLKKKINQLFGKAIFK